MKLGGRLGSTRASSPANSLRLGRIDGVASRRHRRPRLHQHHLDAAAAGALAKAIVERGDAYGTTTRSPARTHQPGVRLGQPDRPAAHRPHPLGGPRRLIARVLRASGAEVATEYYINDAGNQMDNFGASMLAAAEGRAHPRGRLPRTVHRGPGGSRCSSTRTSCELAGGGRAARRPASRYKLQWPTSADAGNASASISTSGPSERHLHARGRGRESRRRRPAARTGSRLRQDGAVWVRTTDFGDDKDRVIRRANGMLHLLRRRRRLLPRQERPRFHPQDLPARRRPPRLHAPAQGDRRGRRGDPETDIEVLIGQLVPINGAKLSKRAGNMIELNDLTPGSARTPCAIRSPGTRPIRRSPSTRTAAEAHQRKPGVLRPVRPRPHPLGRANAAAVRRRPLAPSSPNCSPTDRERSSAPGRLPAHRRPGGRAREPHRMARYLGTWPGLPPLVRRLPGDPARRGKVSDLHRTRLWVNDATGQVLRNGLHLLGVTAPERM